MRARTAILAMNGEASLNLMSRDAAWQPARLPGRNAAPAGRRRAARRSAARGRRAPDRAPLAGRAPRGGRHGADNVRALLAHQLDPQQALLTPQPEATLRLRVGQQELSDGAAWGNAAKLGLKAAPTVVVLDLANMDGGAPTDICRRIEQQGQPCVQVLTRWGGASRQALERLAELIAPAPVWRWWCCKTSWWARPKDGKRSPAPSSSSTSRYSRRSA
ncbi:hypothetical protein LP420_35485 [Massilia sp. B-10]|nr:hypothetical protein LP420_35485 [Massilia sp. B-10]